jgi:7,8-dihydropterin-6-yl-methyl-4-(beta-D-ribofuranosyl)aminobenzene 5'-phosphate synthase
MNQRISPLWWPLLTLSSPITVPWLYKKNKTFKENQIKAQKINQKRFENASNLDLPELEYIELTVLVEWFADKGFLGDAGVSYLFRTNEGSLLFDVGFGPSRPGFEHNSQKIGFHLNDVDALVISHLHIDHMGGMEAQKNKSVSIPDALMPSKPIPCFLPDEASAPGFDAKIVKVPEILPSGMATTGPLARSLFMFGYTEEQALVARVKNKGLVVFTGCGHPTVDVILNMVGRLSPEKVHALGGGLHFPVSDGRGNRIGIKFQTIIGTGKPPWQKINNEDLDKTISRINIAAPQKVYLSGHDTCDQSIERIEKNLTTDTQILKAGSVYKF